MGLEYARQLAAKGYGLMLVSNREEELSAAAEELRTAFPVEVRTHWQDLATEDAADRLYDWCLQEQGILPETNPLLAAYRRAPLLNPQQSDMYGNLISKYSGYRFGAIENSDFWVSNPVSLVNTLTFCGVFVRSL